MLNSISAPCISLDGIGSSLLHRIGGCPGDILIWRMASFREDLAAWAGEADAEVNRAFRIRCLEEAFGLAPGYVARGGSLATGLQQQMLDWMADHRDLELNRPAFERTFADLGDLGRCRGLPDPCRRKRHISTGPIASPSPRSRRQ